MMRRLLDRSHGDSGAAALEFALIIPVLLLVVFGIMQFSLLLRDDIAMNNLVRDASRAASTNPRVGNVQGHAGLPGAPIPSGGTVPLTAEASFAYFAAQKVEASGSGLPKDSIRDMWVYLANAEGYPTTTADWKNNKNRTMTCVPAFCVRYAWKDATDGFRWVQSVDALGNPVGFSTWDPQSINACPRAASVNPLSPDGQAVGIYLRVDHVGLFNGFFNSSRTLTDRNVVKFEPMRADSCSP